MYQITTATKKVAKLKKRIRAIQGGTSASKTISVLLYLIAKAQSDKKPTLTSVVSESFPHLKRGAMKDFLSIMTEHGYYKENSWNRTDSFYEFETGSKIEFFSADQPDKVRGPRRDRLFMNECNNMALETFEQLEIRTNEFIILDWNPTYEFWFYTEVKPKRNDVDHIILTYLDNEALNPNIKNSIEQRKSNVSWWTVYGEGKLGVVEGRIYKDWAPIDTIPHEARLERYGLDFGYSADPTAVIAVYYWNGSFILDEVLFRKGMGNKEIADFFKNQDKAMVVADSAEPKSIEEIRRYGVNIIGAIKGKDSVRNGISLVQEQRIFYTRNSVNLKKAYDSYMWATDKNGNTITPNMPDHYLSDLMDATRYGMITLVHVAEELNEQDFNLYSVAYS